MLGDLEDKITTSGRVLNDERVQHGGEVIRVELDIDNSTHNLGDFTNQLSIGGFVGAPLLFERFEVEGVVATLEGSNRASVTKRNTSAGSGKR